jgi:hypothetical protein
MMRIAKFTAACAALWLSACSDTAAPKSNDGLGDGGTPAEVFASGEEIRVTTSDAGPSFVKLAPASVVSPGGDTAMSMDWDLAFDGYDVFTNGGVSGMGKGASFGPLDATEYRYDRVPVVPFLLPDKTGGAFLDWYGYEQGSHALYSRFHVVGVKDGERLWKVQVLGYYGERDGATIPSLYKIRYAELTADGMGPVIELAGLDGTAGGTAAPPTAPSECVDFGTGARTMLTPSEALQSSVWHICFRRASISVNGESGGPRGIGAVDLGAADSASETLDALKTRTATSEKAAFDATTRASFAARTFRGDHIVSGFGDRWVDRARAEIAPVFASWLVLDANGSTKYLVAFPAFERPSERSPGLVVMRVKPLKG